MSGEERRLGPGYCQTCGKEMEWRYSVACSEECRQAFRIRKGYVSGTNDAGGHKVMASGKEMPVCCREMQNAFESGTDNEEYGSLARSYDNTPASIIIGSSDLRPIIFCPWCGTRLASLSLAKEVHW